MTTAPERLDVVLPKLRAAFRRLERIEGRPGEYADETWIQFLDQREDADPLTDNVWLAGWLVGVADALGIPIADIIKAVRPEPRRRIIKLKRTG